MLRIDTLGRFVGLVGNVFIWWFVNGCMKTWLKGGLIGFLIGVIVHLIYYVIIANPLLTIKYTLFLDAITYICISSGEMHLFCIILGPIINTFLFVLIGIAIGWIVEKVKTRKKQIPRN
jgi:uncharacterized metal-binding protein